MKFGVREICDVVFKAKSDITIGNTAFRKGQPVLLIDTAKTSTLEGAATTVYAQGGKGNARLVAWEGERTLTFTIEDALLSEAGFAILSGAGLFKGISDKEKVHVHKTAITTVGANSTIGLSDFITEDDTICNANHCFVCRYDEKTGFGENYTVSEVGKKTITLNGTVPAGTLVFVDFYVLKSSNLVSELQIDMARFGGFYYVEASTLFREQSTGVDYPAEITIPNAKIQSNFTFTMASTGDPSTFTFTLDAFPGYTNFDNTKKILCAIQIVDDQTISIDNSGSVFDNTHTATNANEIHTITFVLGNKSSGTEIATYKINNGETIKIPAGLTGSVYKNGEGEAVLVTTLGTALESATYYTDLVSDSDSGSDSSSGSTGS